MPVYDYRCTDCGRVVEVTHGIHDTGPAVCEACGGAMRKALSAPAIHFKGSGWAKKDARSAAKPAASASPTPKDEAKADSGTDPGGTGSTGGAGAASERSPESRAPSSAKPAGTGSGAE
jgi:putative FmdB family regulatory protein